ncbi:AAA family ATPase [Amycolatopsis sp. A1MSW2902]|uniref:AAA family ATPase n=1 Tax=Amycolatopsis sp. A1MSW2902 TaxID=687413 RepID=UPI00307E81C1
MNSAFDQAEAGTGCSMIIEGSFGTGKSTFLDAIRDRAGRRGLRTAHTVGSYYERGLSHGVLDQVLHCLARHKEPAQAGTSGQSGPSGQSGLTVSSSGGNGHPNLLSFFAMTPVVVTVDDVQWSDPESLEALAFMARRAATVPLVLVFTANPPEARQHTGLLSELIARIGHQTRIALTDLDTEAATNLVHGLPDGQFLTAEAVHDVVRRAGGNPYLLTELAAAATSRPDGSGHLVLVRIAYRVLPMLRHHSPDLLTITRAVTVLGPFADERRIAALTDLPMSSVRADAATLAALNVLRLGDRWTFAHPVLAEVMHYEWHHEEQARAHLHAARLLHREGVAAEDLVAHLESADQVDGRWVLDVLTEAIAAAPPSKLSPRVVSALGKTSLAGLGEDDRRATLTRLGLAELTTSLPSAIRHLTEAVQASPPGTNAEAALGLVHALTSTGEYTQARSLCHLTRESSRIGSGENRDAAEGMTILLSELDGSGTENPGNGALRRWARLPHRHGQKPLRDTPVSGRPAERHRIQSLAGSRFGNAPALPRPAGLPVRLRPGLCERTHHRGPGRVRGRTSRTSASRPADAAVLCQQPLRGDKRERRVTDRQRAGG